MKVTKHLQFWYPHQYQPTGRPISGTSAKYKLVWKPHRNFPDTPVALTSASKYFLILPAPPGALQYALRLCKSILRCSSKLLQLWKCIQNTTRLTFGMVKLWSCWNLGTVLQKTLRNAEHSVQVWGRLWVWLRPLWKLCGRLGIILTQQRFLEFHNHKAFCLSCWPLLQSQDSLHYNKTYIWSIQVTPFIYMQSVCLQTVLKGTWRSTCRHWLKERRDSLGGNCGETIFFSPPLPANFTGGCGWEEYGDTGRTVAHGDMGIAGKEWAMGSTETSPNYAICMVYLPHAVGSTQSSEAFIYWRNVCGSSSSVAKPWYLQAVCGVPHDWVPLHILSPSSYAPPPARTALSQEFLLDGIRATPLDRTGILWTERFKWRS